MARLTYPDRMRPLGQSRVATQAAICARLETPSFVRMCSTWAAAVFGATVRAAAISRLVIPAATSRATSNSRADKTEISEIEDTTDREPDDAPTGKDDPAREADPPGKDDPGWEDDPAGKDDPGWEDDPAGKDDPGWEDDPAGKDDPAGDREDDREAAASGPTTANEPARTGANPGNGAPTLAYASWAAPSNAAASPGRRLRDAHRA